jgi:hypothetical protein
MSFPLPFYLGHNSIPKCLVERRMVELIGCIRRKPNWEIKVRDSQITNKWQLEAKQLGLSDRQFKYVIRELMSSFFSAEIRLSPVEHVFEADNLINQDLAEQLITLEPISREPDWHPGTNCQVIDLLHPSLHCAVHGVSRLTSKPISLQDTIVSMSRKWDMEAKLIEFKDIELKFVADSGAHAKTDYSHQFQWLPSEFKIAEDGTVSIESYINNLHPQIHQKLYGVIAKIFEKFVPMFNQTLTDLVLHDLWTNRIKVDYDCWEEVDDYCKRKGKVMIEDDEEKGIEGNVDEIYHEYFTERQHIEPDIGAFVPRYFGGDRYTLKGKTVQVITKIAHIILTPENPSYAGGSWHVEGMVNERIVASGIYYYYSDNITESRLEFRQAITDPVYEQGDREAVKLNYGMKNKDPLNEDLGYLITQEGRCITFPNIFQHRVMPFQLADPTRGGIRKILVFFLVDPESSVTSTAHVPPQQEAWAELPKSELHPLMNLNQAKEYREELMKERKYFINQNTKEQYERKFSLCEH